MSSSTASTNKSKPRIAVIGAKGLPSRVDGLEVYIDEVCSRLVDEFDITVFCRKMYCDEIVNEYKGIKIIHIPSINTKHLDAVSYGFFATIIAIVKGFDLMWYHAMGTAVNEWIPKLFHKKILSTVHGLDWKRGRFGKLSSKMVQFGEMSIAKCATEIIVLNKGDAEHFEKKWNRKSEIINNGVIIPEEEKEDSNEHYKNKSYYLFASRITPEKDVKTLIGAFNNVNTKRKLLIAGKGTHVGNYEEEVRELAKDNKNIEFLGYISIEKLRDLYRNS